MRFSSIFASFLLLLVMAVPCSAADSAAKQSLEAHATAILDRIKSPAYANPATRDAERAKIETEVYKIFDFNEFSSRTVGPRWKTLTAEQQKQFTEAFSQLLLKTYLGKVTGYNGEEVAYTGEVSSQKGDRTEVRTVITLNSGKKVPVNYRMLPKGNEWVVYDVIIEGISLVKNYRTQFQDILSKGTPEELISRVRAKSQEPHETTDAK